MASTEQATTTTATSTNTTQDPSFDAHSTPTTTTTTNDPFAPQRTTGIEDTATAAAAAAADTKTQADEWDASKTPPSRFQQRKGSIYATPGSRDGHVARNTERDAAYHAKLEERGWGSGKEREKEREREKDRRASKGGEVGR